MARNSEWCDYAPRDFLDPHTRALLPGFVARSIMLPKITFADDSPADFILQTRMAEQAFSASPSFRGLAIHYYETFRDKMAATASLPPAK